jgi:hypothetical protein|uniref:Uncharacterized protein n=1 Tax=Desulfomonile tiedjei TaxID=2358 RepID=A0A7C4EV07_9BACT
MVIIKPFKVLVYLAISWFIVSASFLPSRADPASGGPGMSGEVLSTDPTRQPAYQSLPSLPSARSYPSGSQSSPNRYDRPKSSSGSRTSYAQSPPVSVGEFPALSYQQPGQSLCSADGCRVPAYQARPVAPPPAGLFATGGIPFGAAYQGPVLPRIGFRQFNLSAKLWHAKLNATTIKWGTDTIGGPGTELDFHNNLGFGKYKYIAEYEARFQVRPNWGIRFSFMPLRYRDNAYPPSGFFFGNTYYAPATNTLTQWDRNIYRWDLVYDWYQKCHATSSVFAGYSLYDDKLTISNFYQSRTRSSGWGLVFAGLSWERVIRNLGASTASTQCRWSLQFCEGYFGYDGYAAARITVPMDCGRFGYVEVGWRWVVLNRDYPTNTDKTSMDGLAGAMGFVF